MILYNYKQYSFMYCVTNLWTLGDTGMSAHPHACCLTFATLN